MPDENAAFVVQFTDQVGSFHPRVNSATRQNPREFSANQIFVQIPKAVLKVFQRFSLGQVVGELFEIAKPHAMVLPMDIASDAHASIVQRNRTQGSH